MRNAEVLKSLEGVINYLVYKQTLKWELADKEELTQVAKLTILENLENYDPTKGALSTYFWWRIHNALTSHSVKFYKSQISLYEDLCDEGTFGSYSDFDPYIPISEDELKRIIQNNSSRPEILWSKYFESGSATATHNISQQLLSYHNQRMKENIRKNHPNLLHLIN